MNKKNIINLILISLVFGCTPYIAPNPVHTQSKAEKTPEPVIEIAPEPQKKISLTYIDTLNRGKEVALSDSTSKPVSSKSGNVSSTTVQSEQNGRFRIQVVASNQAERLKEEKKKFDKQQSLPSVVAFEAPYYKLYAGDFSQRADADAALQKIRKLGYPDAWVATTRALPKQ